MSLGLWALAGLVLALAFGLTGRLLAAASRLVIMDHPNERSLHVAPTPRNGGLAILVSVAVGLAVGWIAGALSGTPDTSLLVILGATLLIGAVSLVDDTVGLPAGFRLGIHGVAAVGVVVAGELQLSTLAIPTLGTFSLGWLAAPVTVLFLMWMTNLYNFMDGMDGLAGGMTVLGFSVWGGLAWQSGQSSLAVLSMLIAAAAGGFLAYNIPPARIFMGDVGSVTLGFLAGTLALQGVTEGLSDLWAPVLIFSPFIVDATVTLIRRLLRGEQVWQAHREHYYQRLVLAGWGHRKTVMAEYMLMLACGISAVGYVQVSEPWRLAILLGWIALCAMLMRGVSVVERQAKVVGAAE